MASIQSTGRSSMLVGEVTLVSPVAAVISGVSSLLLIKLLHVGTNCKFKMDDIRIHVDSGVRKHVYFAKVPLDTGLGQRLHTCNSQQLMITVKYSQLVLVRKNGKAGCKVEIIVEINLIINDMTVKPLTVFEP